MAHKMSMARIQLNCKVWLSMWSWLNLLINSSQPLGHGALKHMLIVNEVTEKSPGLILRIVHQFIDLTCDIEGGVIAKSLTGRYWPFCLRWPAGFGTAELLSCGLRLPL